MVSYTESLDGMKFKALEFEEQAYVRRLVREGKAQFLTVDGQTVVKVVQ